MWKKTIAVVLIGASLSACQTNPLRKKSSKEPSALDGSATLSGGLAASTQQRFDDVPLPSKAKEDIERTFVYRSRSIEIGRMVYTSRASVSDISQFYIESAAGMGWKLENVLQAEGVQLLFTKPGKRMFVTARPSGMSKGNTLFIVNLIPDDPTGPAGNQPFRVNTSPLTR
jgi:hypothetical protein